MENKNKKETFNVEKEYEFYMNRLSTCISPDEKKKGQQMQKYLETSVLFNPEDVNYSKEQLQEKLNKTKEIEILLEKLLKEGE